MIESTDDNLQQQQILYLFSIIFNLCWHFCCKNSRNI